MLLQFALFCAEMSFRPAPFPPANGLENFFPALRLSRILTAFPPFHCPQNEAKKETDTHTHTLPARDEELFPALLPKPRPRRRCGVSYLAIHPLSLGTLMMVTARYMSSRLIPRCASLLVETVTRLIYGTSSDYT